MRIVRRARRWHPAADRLAFSRTASGPRRRRLLAGEPEIIEGVRVGIAHHLGWAVAVTASAGHEVVDRRRIELIEAGMPTAPVEHDAQRLGDAAAARMVEQVRASVLRATSASLDQLAGSLPGPVVSMSLRAWPLDFPDDTEARRPSPTYRCVILDLCVITRSRDNKGNSANRSPRTAGTCEEAATILRGTMSLKPAELLSVTQ
jgi:hypothetical protein